LNNKRDDLIKKALILWQDHLDQQEEHN